MEAFVFINTHGESDASSVFKALEELNHPGGRLTHLNMLKGPFNIVGRVESPDCEALGKLIVEGIQRVEGITLTTTCLRTGNIYRAE